MDSKGEGIMEKGGKRMRIPEFLRLEGGTDTKSELNSQTLTHTFREEKRRGGGKVENGNTQRTNHLQIHKLPVSTRLSHTNY